MHRSAASNKCNFLALGKWRTELTQNMIPYDFFTLSEHLDFLGITLKATFGATRRANGEILKERIKQVINPWRGGRFICLNLRPHSVNCYAYSKLLYRCNIVDLRSEDLQAFTSAAKSFVYLGLLDKPTETVLYRETKDGGLGLLHIRYRAKAALLSTFLQTAINPNFYRNNYHNVMYRKYVLNEQIEAPKIPQSLASGR